MVSQIIGSASLALRRCVWLFDNRHIQLLDVYQSFLFALRTEQGEIRERRVIS
jgi:hypothetical protein